MAKQVVVLGGGVGGLSAAIYARLYGHDVLLIERHETLGGKARSIEEAGYRFDLGPSIIILKRIYEQLFKDAGRSMDKYIKFNRLDTLSRTFFGGNVYDLPASRPRLLEFLKAIDPGDERALSRLLDIMERAVPGIESLVFNRPIESVLQMVNPRMIALGTKLNLRESYKMWIDRWFEQPLMKAFFYGFPSYAGQSYDRPSIAGLMIPYYMITEGVYFPEGGVSAIPAGLEKLAREVGVEIVTGQRVIHLQTNTGGKLSSLRLQGGAEYKFDALISNLDRSATRALLGLQERGKPSYSYFTMHLGLKRRNVDFAHHNLVIPDNFLVSFEDLYRQRQFPQQPVIYLNETTSEDPSTAPAGCTNLFAVVSSPACEAHLDWRTLEAEAKKRVFAGLEKIGFEIQPWEIETEITQTPITFEERDGNFRGSLYGIDEADRPMGGMFPPSVRDRDFRNLFYAGGSVQPGAGLPMVVLSGKFAAAQV